jgi:hypothetical protein
LLNYQLQVSQCIFLLPLSLYCTSVIPFWSLNILWVMVISWLILVCLLACAGPKFICLNCNWQRYVSAIPSLVIIKADHSAMLLMLFANEASPVPSIRLPAYFVFPRVTLWVYAFYFSVMPLLCNTAKESVLLYSTHVHAMQYCHGECPSISILLIWTLMKILSPQKSHWLLWLLQPQSTYVHIPCSLYSNFVMPIVTDTDPCMPPPAPIVEPSSFTKRFWLRKPNCYCLSCMLAIMSCPQAVFCHQDNVEVVKSYVGHFVV